MSLFFFFFLRSCFAFCTFFHFFIFLSCLLLFLVGTYPSFPPPLRARTRTHKTPPHSVHSFLPIKSFLNLPSRPPFSPHPSQTKKQQTGNKTPNLKIIYTPWPNLHKNASMATGQVGFHNPRLTRTILIPTRLNSIINRLNRTRTVIDPDDLSSLREAHLAEIRKNANAEKKEKKKEEERVARERREEKEKMEKGYVGLLHGDDEMEGRRMNEEGWDDDDFM